MLGEELMSLASTAAQTIVSAAAADGWERVKQGFGRLLGRGDKHLAEAAERRLEGAREELAAVPGRDLEVTRARLTAAWQTRLLDLLEDAPGLADEVRALVSQIQADTPGGLNAADAHGVAAGRDINVTASGRAVAAGTIEGNVLTGNPIRPGTAS